MSISRTPVNIARRGDALYAIPLDFTPMVMYYNKRLFDAARRGVSASRGGRGVISLDASHSV